MQAKAKKGKKKLAVTIIYLVVITVQGRERKEKSIFFFSLSLALSSLSLSRRRVFFYLQAIEAITTNRNIGTGTAYNTIHTYIERPLAIFFSYQHYFLSSFSLCLSSDLAL